MSPGKLKSLYPPGLGRGGRQADSPNTILLSCRGSPLAFVEGLAIGVAGPSHGHSSVVSRWLAATGFRCWCWAVSGDVTGLVTLVAAVCLLAMGLLS